jgi:hypothetical protein
MQDVGLSNTSPHSLKDSNANLKVKTTKEERFGAHSLVCSISKIERHAGALGWGLRGVTSGSILHTDLHKPNNKLVSVWFEHLWCMNKPRAYTDS